MRIFARQEKRSVKRLPCVNGYSRKKPVLINTVNWLNLSRRIIGSGYSNTRRPTVQRWAKCVCQRTTSSVISSWNQHGYSDNGCGRYLAFSRVFLSFLFSPNVITLRILLIFHSINDDSIHVIRIEKHWYFYAWHLWSDANSIVRLITLLTKTTKS